MNFTPYLRCRRLLEVQTADILTVAVCGANSKSISPDRCLSIIPASSSAEKGKESEFLPNISGFYYCADQVLHPSDCIDEPDLCPARATHSGDVKT